MNDHKIVPFFNYYTEIGNTYLIVNKNRHDNQKNNNIKYSSTLLVPVIRRGKKKKNGKCSCLRNLKEKNKEENNIFV